MTAKKKSSQAVEDAVTDYLDGQTTPQQAVERMVEIDKLDKAAAADTEARSIPIPLKVVKPKAKPGTKDYDWAAEYPDEEVYVFTSEEGLTIGLTKLGPNRKPKPGKLRRLHREGGLSVMWYFLELASTTTSLALQEELDELEYDKMLRGWAEFAGIDLGE